MEHITNKVDRTSLKHGDHIYVYRKLQSYSHHGIFIGEDRVIHYNRTGEGNTSRGTKPCRNCGADRNQLKGVVKTCIDCFLKGHTLRRFRYGVGYVRYLTNRAGTCTTGLAHPPEVSISRANDLLNMKDGFGDYDLFENNCEAFSVYCKTEKRVSDQARTATLMIKAGVKFSIERLLGDVLVQQGEEKYRMLKQKSDIWLDNVSTLKEVIDELRKDKESSSHQFMITGP